MKNWLYKNRGKLIAAVCIILLLLAAWFYGDGSGNSKSSPGESVAENQGTDSDKTNSKNLTPGSYSDYEGIKSGNENTKMGTTPSGNDGSGTDSSRVENGSDGSDPSHGENGNNGIDPVPAVSVTPGPDDKDSNSGNASKKDSGNNNEKNPAVTGQAESGHGSSGTGNIETTPSLTGQAGRGEGGSKPSTTPTGNRTGNTPTPTVQPSQTPTPTATVTPAATQTAWDKKCTIYIDCKTILPHLSELNPKLAALIPSDGVILAETETGFSEGETVFDVLQRICNEKNIALDYSKVPAFKTVYVKGLADLYEFDVGDLSGWQYFLNDEYVPVGCSACYLKEGDKISWRYTCDLGRDL